MACQPTLWKLCGNTIKFPEHQEICPPPNPTRVPDIPSFNYPYLCFQMYTDSFGFNFFSQMCFYNPCFNHWLCGWPSGAERQGTNYKQITQSALGKGIGGGCFSPHGSVFHHQKMWVGSTPLRMLLKNTPGLELHKRKYLFRFKILL